MNMHIGNKKMNNKKTDKRKDTQNHCKWTNG